MYSKSLVEILSIAISKQASDVHLVADLPPYFRIHGDLMPSELASIGVHALEQLIFSMLTEEQKSIFLRNRELDFSYNCLEDYQFRANIHKTRGQIAATIRITPIQIKTSRELNLPAGLQDIARKRKGLVIISGTAGSGKSTTLTYLIDLINRERKCKIVTIEDPIEYVHQSINSLVIQREVGSDTNDFATALKYALRQDPDVVVIGEMRDLESISMALTTAETGHLVFTTVHAPDTIETINRIIDVYPIGSRDQICAQLAGNLLAVISQTLVPRQDSLSRILATEVLVSTLPVQNLIRRGALVELRGQLNSEEEIGTHSLENCLSDLVRKNLITKSTALQFTRYAHLLKFDDEEDTPKPAVRRNFFGRPIQQEDKIKKQKILIIDSNDPDRENMLTVLKQHGFTSLLEADNGRSGLEKVMTERPDLVVLDTNLFDVPLDSFQVCHKIKENVQLKCKVIMITANLQVSTSAKAKESGADDFVIKTLAYELLIKSIYKLLEPPENLTDVGLPV